jgi:hypothetical protein
VVELSNGDFTSCYRRPIAAEIDKQPLMTSQIMSVTKERYTVDSKHALNTKRKPWSTNRLVASFPVCDVISHLGHVTCVNRVARFSFLQSGTTPSSTLPCPRPLLLPCFPLPFYPLPSSTLLFMASVSKPKKFFG